MAKLIAKKFNYGINGNQELMGEVIKQLLLSSLFRRSRQYRLTILLRIRSVIMMIRKWFEIHVLVE